MSLPLIEIDNLGKKYTLQRQTGRAPDYRRLSEELVATLKKPFHRAKSHAADRDQEEFWALRDISFDVSQGEVVGIIGRNGAGKSTLLKILSRITEPTAGRVRLKGRVSSLLEVGTGFHPELSGRENIFLNGAILGMTRAEIRRKFAEIVAFAELEKFLDTPVKRYSSGMYVRLAFAVAAHLEPEILVVDEVLAVGDQQFQKRCLGKMGEVARDGRTILFVSHNMSAIQSLCRRAIVLQQGQVLTDQLASAAVQLYLRDAAVANFFSRPAAGDGRPTLVHGRLTHDDCGGCPGIQLMLEIATTESRCVSMDMRLTDGLGVPAGFGSLGSLDARQLLELQGGVNTVSARIPLDRLAVGNYLLSLDLTVPDIEFLDRADNCLSFDVARPPAPGSLRVLNQAWGYGSVEIPIETVCKRHQ